MKKRNLKFLNLNKNIVSNINNLLSISGGAGYSEGNTQCGSRCLACDAVPSKGSKCCDQ